jgi:hypothetical protein
MSQISSILLAKLYAKSGGTALPIILYACEGLTKKEPLRPFLFSITKS